MPGAGYRSASRTCSCRTSSARSASTECGPYPIRADFPVSGASHLDTAYAVVALFDRTDVTGSVSVGQYPAITGPELTEAFGVRLGRDVVFDQITTEEFRPSMAPLIRESAAADLAGAHQAMTTMAGRSTPRSCGWS
ncbi:MULTISPECIES: hypothetical protein [unclassified Streptomyces]|uniref:hypothetical protein n=1 Tax=unclassified Streptomyces TaxID=2593676 RepID=UPI000BE384E9|nr:MULTISPECIES: hypothetical protein [unclassified Streptomyces]